MGGFYSKLQGKKPLFHLLEKEKIKLPDLVNDFAARCCEIEPGRYIPVYQFNMALFEYIMLYLEIYTCFIDLDIWEQKSIRDDLVSYVDNDPLNNDQIDEDRPGFLLYDDEVYTGIDVVTWPNRSTVNSLNFKTD